MRLIEFLNEQEDINRTAVRGDSQVYWMRAIGFIAKGMRDDYPNGNVPRQVLDGAAKALSGIYPKLNYDKALTRLKTEIRSSSHRGDTGYQTKSKIENDAEK